MSDVLDFSTIVDTTDPVTYQAGDYPASLYVVAPGDQPGFGSYGFNNYRIGAGLGIPALHYMLKGRYRSGTYTFNYPYSYTTCFCGENNFEVATLLRDSSVHTTYLQLNTLDGITQSVPNPDPGSVGAPSPEPGSPWENPDPQPPTPKDPPKDPDMPPDGNGFPPTDPYPLPPIYPEVPAP